VKTYGDLPEVKPKSKESITNISPEKDSNSTNFDGATRTGSK
jgi:hypothetical protein